jgi:hypothetical protein
LRDVRDARDGRDARPVRGVHDSNDRGDELIPALRQRPDESRRVRAVAEGSADLRHAEIETAIEVDERRRAPQRLTERLARHGFAGVHHEKGQHVSRLGLQADRHAFTPQLA